MAQQDVLAVPLNAVHASEHLYLIGGRDGQVGSFRHFAELLPGVAVTGLTLSRPAPPGTKAAGLAGAYRARIEAAEMTRPGERVHVAGYSSGSYLAIEVARHWPDPGRLGTVLVLDVPVRPGPLAPGSALAGQWNLARDHGYLGGWDDFLALARTERIARVAAQWDGPESAASKVIWITHLFTTIERNTRALLGHNVLPYHGPVGVVVAERTRSTSTDPTCWRDAFPEGAGIAAVSGSHTDIPGKRTAAELSSAIGSLL